MENDIARIELATAHRALASYNLNEGVNNHMTSKAISRFDESKEIILMLPFGKQWSDARPDDFLEIDSGTVSEYDISKVIAAWTDFKTGDRKQFNCNK